MPKRKSKRARRRVVAAPFVEHRAECWIIASRAAARGQLQLLAAIDEQQSARRISRRRVRRAIAEFKEALRWSRISRARVKLPRALGGADE